VGQYGLDVGCAEMNPLPPEPTNPLSIRAVGMTDDLHQQSNNPIQRRQSPLGTGFHEVLVSLLSLLPSETRLPRKIDVSPRDFLACQRLSLDQAAQNGFHVWDMKQLLELLGRQTRRTFVH
jgi:hypothetical protein